MLLPKELKEKFSRPMKWFVNPYFDELIIFFKKELLTSQDKYKPYNCDECGKQFYVKENKRNKTDFVIEMQNALLENKNTLWPFKENLLVQYSVSDIPSKIKSVDLDNLAKTLFDSLKGVVFVDDSQIVALAGDKNIIIDYENNIVSDIKAFVVAIKRLENGEKPIYQQYLWSGDENCDREEREEKLKSGKQINFTLIDFSKI